MSCALGDARLQGLSAHPQVHVHGPRPGRCGVFDVFDRCGQDAALLKRTSDRPAAQALLGMLRSERARATIAAHGYALAPP